ncbi:DUF2231 domain-containing protein [Nocardia xishanensis]|uniref:DUF2231 domain-containing protein n=1 Tax=Nocardia xishanensis TaxID=238964 RepID=UPI000A99C887|nr:DUF2231 domain-containing protein [Nocardia xishanensis]
MTSEMQKAKQPVVSMVSGPYGHPFHPILVTVPIGAWVASVVFDIGSRIVDDPQFLARGAMWLVAIGVLGALVAAVIGLLDLLAIPTGTTAFRTGLVHMSLNLAVTAAFVVGFFWRNSGGGPQGAVSWGQLVLSLVALAALGVSGYLGGQLAYHYGVRVADEATQATGFQH